jgi:CSLREA domain-containing protein
LNKLATILLLLVTAPAAWAATFTVDSNADEVDASPGDGSCSSATGRCTLRAAIQEANTLAGADTINLPAGTYTLTIAGTGEAAATTGDLDIIEDLTLTGAGANATIVDGGALDRVFDLQGGGPANISDITIQNGNVAGIGEDGGGIRCDGVLTVLNVTVKGNSAKNGGGVATSGNGNSSTLTNVTLSGNSADKGGGIHGTGGGTQTTMTNCTISGNSAASDGGGAFLDQATLANVTITNNTSAGNGGGINKGGGSLLSVKSVIIADNPAGADCAGTITSLGNNLDSDGSCGLGGPGDISSGTASLGPLADNGGPTQTHALLAGSDAIDAVLAGCPPPGTDQRGVIRPQGGQCDIGAFEVTISTISGTVFEDVNYGGGIGRDLAAAAAAAPSFAVGRDTVTVELYDNAGSFVTSTTTAGGGTYSFDVLPGTYTVRVVNTTVSSSRPGSDGSELAVQTYRADGASEAAGDGAKKVGGERPSNEDAPANSGAQTLAALQGTDLDADGVTDWTQSIVTVDASGGDVTGVGFGFNFDTIVNTNDSGQGTLRQFILNSNLLN